jgi:hypothetical protein
MRAAINAPGNIIAIGWPCRLGQPLSPKVKPEECAIACSAEMADVEQHARTAPKPIAEGCAVGVPVQTAAKSDRVTKISSL